MPAETQPARWTLLRTRYQSRGLVLALGAGVSCGCGLPNWPELLLRVGEACLPRHGRELVQQLLSDGVGLPAIAGILESKCPRSRAYVEVVRDALYADFPYRHAITTRQQRQDLVKFVHTRSPTLRAVAALCVVPGADGGYAPNPRIHAVVNFNLDSVLRTYASARYDTYLFRTIERADKTQRLGRIAIYHMHGLVRFDHSRPDPAEHEDIRAVLTEGEYFDVFNQPHSVFNYTFLYLLREFNCLFIGLSMNDENIRRLLHYSTAERRQPAAGSRRGERVGLRHFAILRRTSSSEIDDLLEISLRRLGVRILWINRFAEVPERLAHVYDPAAWGRVY